MSATLDEICDSEVKFIDESISKKEKFINKIKNNRTLKYAGVGALVGVIMAGHWGTMGQSECYANVAELYNLTGQDMINNSLEAGKYFVPIGAFVGGVVGKIKDYI